MKKVSDDVQDIQIHSTFILRMLLGKYFLNLIFSSVANKHKIAIFLAGMPVRYDCGDLNGAGGCLRDSSVRPKFLD